MADCFGFTLSCVPSNSGNVPSLKEKLSEISLLNAEEMHKLAVSLGVNANSRVLCLPLQQKSAYYRFSIKQDGIKLVLNFDTDDIPHGFDHYEHVRNVFSVLVLALRQIDPDCEISIVGYDENEYDEDDFFEDDISGEEEKVGRHSYVYKPKDSQLFYYWFTRDGVPQDFDMPGYEDMHPDFRCAKIKGKKRGQPVSLVGKR